MNNNNKYTNSESQNPNNFVNKKHMHNMIIIKNRIKNNGAQVKIATKTVANLYLDLIGSTELSNFYYRPLSHVNKSFIQLIIPVDRRAVNILLIIDFNECRARRL